MEHIKKYWSLYFLGLVAVIIIALNWRKWFGSKSPKDGDSCTTKDSNGISIAGEYKNGVCIPTSAGPGPGGNGSNTQI